ncbi:hypothetical protein Ahy_A07g037049 [Arachis hypogaea]|uniref:Uncharacterized protein n=1 Tax=Arachis hypogaea TaxID=3818 RepID=A0A445CHN3_ARAHY|nr:hypothetical protein Ahy_A07g037049 [Arachis hypogaea]
MQVIEWISNILGRRLLQKLHSLSSYSILNRSLLIQLVLQVRSTLSAPNYACFPNLQNLSICGIRFLNHSYTYSEDIVFEVQKTVNLGSEAGKRKKGIRGRKRIERGGARKRRGGGRKRIREKGEGRPHRCTAAPLHRRTTAPPPVIGRGNKEQERRKLREKREIGREKAKGHRRGSSPSPLPLLLLVVQSPPLDFTMRCKPFLLLLLALADVIASYSLSPSSRRTSSLLLTLLPTSLLLLHDPSPACCLNFFKYFESEEDEEVEHNLKKMKKQSKRGDVEIVIEGTTLSGVVFVP